MEGNGMSACGARDTQGPSAQPPQPDLSNAHWMVFLSFPAGIPQIPPTEHPTRSSSAPHHPELKTRQRCSD